MATLTETRRSLVDCDEWATNRLLEAACGGDAALDEPAGSADRTARNPTVHAVGTMSVWQARPPRRAGPAFRPE
ncbi:MAG: hypothetical protein FJZ92_07315 [Chloroflexi bacterium]|nr:hypothetical protein [Chloroflexota bacterium]